MFRGKGYFCHIRCHESNCSKCYCPFKHSGETETSKDILTAVDFQTGIQMNILKRYIDIRIPTVKLKIPGKSIFEIGIPNFCFIKVIVFDLSYLPVTKLT